jgi:hypothetical protein
MKRAIAMVEVPQVPSRRISNTYNSQEKDSNRPDLGYRISRSWTLTGVLRCPPTNGSERCTSHTVASVTLPTVSVGTPSNTLPTDARRRPLGLWLRASITR